jgi:hypothetical protein
MTESAPLDPRPTDQLPAIVRPAALTSPIDAYAASLVPALIADAGDAAGWRQAAAIAPGEEPAARPRIGAPCIRVADVGGEEFDIAPECRAPDGRSAPPARAATGR